MSIDAEAGPEDREARHAAAPPPEVELDSFGFDAFFAREYPRLVTLLTAVTGSRPVAEEIGQEAMLRAHQRWARISRYDLPAAWLRRVALNLANQSWARRRTERRTVERLAGQRPATVPEPAGDDFWAIVRRLPNR